MMSAIPANFAFRLAPKPSGSPCIRRRLERSHPECSEKAVKQNFFNPPLHQLHPTFKMSSSAQNFFLVLSIFSFFLIYKKTFFTVFALLILPFPFPSARHFPLYENRFFFLVNSSPSSAFPSFSGTRNFFFSKWAFRVLFWSSSILFFIVLLSAHLSLPQTTVIFSAFLHRPKFPLPFLIWNDGLRYLKIGWMKKFFCIYRWQPLIPENFLRNFCFLLNSLYECKVI